MYFEEPSDIILNFTKLFSTRSAGKSCPRCGTSSQEFLDSGFLGCPYCYEALAETVLPVVQRVQNDTLHVGKVPLDNQNTLSEYERLKRDLKRAIDDEDYEQAAALSAKIKTVMPGEVNKR